MCILCHRLHAAVADRRPLPKPRQLTIAYRTAHAADPRPDETYFFEDAKTFKDSMEELLCWSGQFFEVLRIFCHLNTSPVSSAVHFAQPTAIPCQNLPNFIRVFHDVSHIRIYHSQPIRPTRSPCRDCIPMPHTTVERRRWPGQNAVSFSCVCRSIELVVVMGWPFVEF